MAPGTEAQATVAVMGLQPLYHRSTSYNFSTQIEFSRDLDFSKQFDYGVDFFNYLFGVDPFIFTIYTTSVAGSLVAVVGISSLEGSASVPTGILMRGRFYTEERG